MAKKDPFNIAFSNPDGEKLIGAYMPRSLADYIATLALYEQTSSSTILRRMIDEYIENREDDQYMVRVLANRAYKEWMHRWKENKHKSSWKYNMPQKYEEYCEEIEAKLKKRGLSWHRAKEVIDQLELLYNPHEIV